MARGLNRVILLGNVGRDVEIVDFPQKDGTPGRIAKIRLAVEQSPQKDADPCWIDVVVWNGLAKNDNFTTWVTKGSRLLVEGTLKENKWEAEDGTKRSRHEVHVNLNDTIVFGFGGNAQDAANALSKAATPDFGDVPF